MTVGKLIELLAGKAASEEGTFRDASAFASNDISSATAAGTTNKNESVDEIGEALLKAGYASDGKETLICGLTGEYLQARIFTGPVYYQKLKHMVLDKMHARALEVHASFSRDNPRKVAPAKAVYASAKWNATA